MGGDQQRPLSATAFTPLEATATRRRFAFSPVYAGVGLLAIVAALVLIFLFAARAVIFRLDPGSADIDVSGISFHIGDNFLLLRGEHRVTATAEGYHPLEQTISVGDQRTQEIALQLEALPGNLEVRSELDEIAVSIDDRPAGTVPGTISDIARGTHLLEFSKYRYFPSQQEIEIEGLGRTQTLTVELAPAWGQMRFSSVPAGAQLYIDERLVGQTPITAEVLETGSDASLSARGYKTWRKRVSVQAGTEAEHPPVQLIVADGTLDIRSAPAGAHVTIDNEFRGTTPLSVPLSPLREHRVELLLEGYRKATRNVNVQPESHAALAVDLKPVIGRIQVRVEPAQAEVWVDGGSHGRGSQTLALTAKEHVIEVRLAGHATQSFTITPHPEREQSLEVKLLTVDQAYWATRPPLITSPVGSRLKLFRPAATFSLGAPRREPGRRANEAQRNVRLERPFYLGTHEVTNEEFRRWRGEHSSGAVQGFTLDMDDQPVVNVSWLEAALYCNWLSRREGLPLFYVEERGLVTGIDLDAHGYRLPTEAEWAWVARIDAQGAPVMFPWGDERYPPERVVENYADQRAAAIINFTLSNYDDGYPVSAPVGQFSANDRGIYDMSGNVSEWISDAYEIRPARGEPERDPTGPALGDRHVIRGASWSKASRSELRLSFRDAGAEAAMDVGFRIARYVDRPDVEP